MEIKLSQLTKDLNIQDFFDTFSDGIMITDEKGKIVIYNRAKEIQDNRDRKEMLGKYTWEAYGYTGREGSEHWSDRKSVV